jgi:hypothetical protein
MRCSSAILRSLHSRGRIDQAIGVLEHASKSRPADREILSVLIAFEQDKGNPAIAGSSPAKRNRRHVKGSISPAFYSSTASAANADSLYLIAS